MKRRKKLLILSFAIAGFLLLALLSLYFIVRAGYPRVCEEQVEKSGLAPSLVYSVIKAESGFDAEAESSAGAKGLMQLLPSTALFIAERNGIAFEEAKLFDPEYNVTLGCLYLEYLLERFPEEQTALTAYNAGEGVVRGWLKDASLSPDGKTLPRIPYPETEGYVKKIAKFRKFYEFFYG